MNNSKLAPCLESMAQTWGTCDEHCASSCSLLQRIKDTIRPALNESDARARVYISLVYDLHRDRTRGRMRNVARNHTEVEARLLHQSVRQNDRFARLVWLVKHADLAELRGWRLPDTTLVGLHHADLMAWSRCARSPPLLHHSGPQLGLLKLMLPLLQLPRPSAVMDSDTIALRELPNLWRVPAIVRLDPYGRELTPLRSRWVPRGLKRMEIARSGWVLVGGSEHDHLNGGLIMWHQPPEPAAWMRCVRAGTAFLARASAQPQRAYTGSENVKYGEQAVLVHMCVHSRNASWRRETGCELDCRPHSSRTYSTGCSPDWDQAPTAAYHYNCQPRKTLERARCLLERPPCFEACLSRGSSRNRTERALAVKCCPGRGAC